MILLPALHALQTGLQTGLGIDQELAGNDHLLPFLEPGDDLDIIAGLYAGHHLARRETAIALCDDDTCLAATIDQPLAWDVQDPVTRPGIQANIGVHVRLE